MLYNPISISTKLDQYYFFQRGTIKEYCIFGIVTLSKKVNDHEMLSYNGSKDFNLDAIFHVYKKGDIIVGAVTDTEYPIGSVKALLKSMVLKTMVSSSDLPDIDKVQDPREVDKIYKLESKLDEIKDIMRDNIDLILDRGEKLETLIEKTDLLSQQSKIFQKRAAKMNACCKSW